MSDIRFQNFDASYVRDYGYPREVIESLHDNSKQFDFEEYQAYQNIRDIVKANFVPSGFQSSKSSSFSFQKRDIDQYYRSFMAYDVYDIPFLDFKYDDCLFFCSSIAKSCDDDFTLSYINVIKRFFDLVQLPLPSFKTIDGLRHRLSESKTFKKLLRNALTRACDAGYVRKGFVKKGGRHYVSEIISKSYVRKQEITRDWMQAEFLAGDDGSRFAIYDSWLSSTSNPINRQAELMVRIRGAQEYAEKNGYVGLFLTATAASHYHPSSKKYDGKSLAVDSQRSLNESWKLIRTYFDDNEISFYGGRFVEPHEDSATHWHSLLFMRPEHVDHAVKIMGQYFLSEDGDEPGAAPYEGCDHFDERRINKKGHLYYPTKDDTASGKAKKHIPACGARFKAVRIDPKKGDACAYVVKYITKNTGLSLNDDGCLIYDNSSGGMDIKAWSSLHNIRQFQFFGLPGVGIWRELRKMSWQDAKLMGRTVLRLKGAAEKQSFCRYIELMGGVKFQDKLVRPVKLYREEYLNSYGEKSKRIIGLETVDISLITHTVKFEREQKVFNESDMIHAMLNNQPFFDPDFVESDFLKSFIANNPGLYRDDSKIDKSSYKSRQEFHNKTISMILSYQTQDELLTEPEREALAVRTDSVSSWTSDNKCRLTKRPKIIPKKLKKLYLDYKGDNKDNMPKVKFIQNIKITHSYFKKCLSSYIKTLYETDAGWFYFLHFT